MKLFSSRLFFAVTVLLIVVLSGSAWAGTTEALAKFSRHLDEAAPLEAKVRAALTDDNSALRDGVDKKALAATAAALSQKLVAAARASQGIADADSEKSGPKKAFARHWSMKMTLIHAGYAAPGIFLSDSGRSSAESFWSSMDVVKKYREEIESGKGDSGTMHDLENYYARALRTYNALSQADKMSANGQAMVNSLKYQSQFVQQTKAGWAKQAEAGKEAQAYCKQVDEKFRADAHYHTLMELVALLRGRTPQPFATLDDKAVAAWKERIAKRRKLVAELNTVCGDAQRRATLEHCKPTHGKPRLEGLYAKTDPIVWCMAAEKSEELMLGELQSFIAEDDKIASSFNTSPAKLERHEGWMSDDLLKGWNDLLTFPKKRQEETLAEYQALFDALGVEVEDTEKFFAARIASIAKLRAAVEKLAPRWKRLHKGPNFYGVDLAKKSIKSAFRGAKIVAAHGKSADWTVTKNALGIPTHRARKGWILFKAKGEPLCQMRTFSVAEDYAGGKYKRAKHVVFSQLRWQKCQ